MRRGRWVAALVLFAASIVLFLVAKDGLLYERHTWNDSVVYYERRLDWMPVPEFSVPAQLCLECQGGREKS